ncbi:MAG: DMT family transporter [Burkholderiaceae bacterium]
MSARHVAELLLLSLLWGSAYLFTRAAVPAFGPVPLIALRFAIASCLLLPVLAARGGLPLLREHRWRFLVLGSFFTAIPFLLIAFAAQSLGAGLLAILNATAPLFGAVVGRLWLGERIGPMRASGLVVGFAGVVVLLWGSAAAAPGALLAIALMLLTSASWGFAANYTRARLGRIDPIAITTGNMLVAALAIGPFAVPAWPTELPAARAWVEMLILGVLCSGGGMLLYFRLLRAIGTVPTMSVTFLSPVVAVVSGALYLGEPITTQTVLGGTIVLAGIALVLRLVPVPGRRR